MLKFDPTGDSKNSDGILKWWISDGGTSIQFWLKDKLVMKNEVKLGDGKWRHICQNWEGSSGHWTLHISGLKSLTGKVDEQVKSFYTSNLSRSSKYVDDETLRHYAT